jgi:GNAT superfamily N-acetyltransferase
MDPTIRPGRPDDLDAIRSFTAATFDWGDYVSERFPAWVRDPDGAVLVAVDPKDQPIGLVRVSMVSDKEAWAQGARVHPDHRRRGIAAAVTDEVAHWAAARGAHVVRLVVEDWNEAATAQVQQSGFRPVSPWVVAERPVGAASPVPEGNGGQRVSPPERLSPAASAEAEAAYVSWAGSELATVGRELIPVGWSWRRLTPDDLVAAGRHQALWEGRPGWAVGERGEDAFSVSWLDTGPDDAVAMVRALVDAGAQSGRETLRVKAPGVDWLVAALQDRYFELRPMTVYARSL